jgi:hypothetical protein
MLLLKSLFRNEQDDINRKFNEKRAITSKWVMGFT